MTCKTRRPGLLVVLILVSIGFRQCDMQSTAASDLNNNLIDNYEKMNSSMETLVITDIMIDMETKDYTDAVTLSGSVGVGEINVDYWQWQPIEWVWWSILQLVSAIVGLFGNVLVILVIFQRKAKRSSTDILIGSLAVADLMTSIFLVPLPGVINVPSTWLGEVYCKVVYTARFMWTSVSASVFTLTLISVERFVAVAYPFRFKELFSRRHVALYIAIVWILAIIMNSFAFFIFFVDADTHDCTISFPTANGGEILGLASFFLVLVNPVAVMLVTQALTVYKLHLEAKRFQDSDVKSTSQPSYRLLRAKKRVIKLLLVINVTFVICWAPDQSAYLAFNMGLLSPSYLYGPVDRTLVVLAFCNSCANPIIYTIQHPNFRSAIKGLFARSSENAKTPIFMKE